MNVPFRHAAKVLCVVLLSTAMLNAQEKVAKVSLENKPVTHVYDVKSFLQTVSNYPNRGAAPGGGQAVGWDGGMFEPTPGTAIGEMGMMDPGLAAPASSPARGQELSSLIKETVDPESWRDNGGATGSVRLLGSSLIVTQTPENQRLVADLLTQLRDLTQRAVRVRADWITLSEGTEQFVDRNSDAQGNEAQAAVFPVVNLAELAKAQPDAIRYRGEIICFNGQTVHIAAGRGRSVVTELMPVVGPSAVGYQPTIKYIRSGAMLQVTPSIEAGGTVVVDLQSSVNELDNPEDVPLIDVSHMAPTTQGVATGGGITHIDQLSALSQNFATTVRLPVGKPILIGGMTMPATGPDPQQLYLVLEVVAGE